MGAAPGHEAHRETWGLTPRSSRPATAGAAWPLRAIVVIVLPRPAGAYLRGRLNSNVRPHETGGHCA